MANKKQEIPTFLLLNFGGVIIPNTTFVNDARVMPKRQVTIPKNVRSALGIEAGDRVTYIVDGTNVRVVNSAVYALMRLRFS